MLDLNERGLTMLELLVCMFLLAVALIGLGASFPYAMYGVTAGGYQTTATLLAQQSIETAKNTDYASLPSMTGVSSTTCGPTTGTFATVPSFPGFARCINVQTASSPSVYTTVTVIVRFSGVVPSPIYDTTLATVIAG